MEQKIDVDTIKAILRDHLDIQKQAEILKEINKALQEDKEAGSDEEQEQGEKPPKVEKKTIVIITALPSGIDEKLLEDVAGFVTEIAVETPVDELPTMLREVANEYKNTKKAKKNPADSMGDLFEVASGALFKAQGIFKKPKGPLQFIHVPNR